jgi:hypothetical protein
MTGWSFKASLKATKNVFVTWACLLPSYFQKHCRGKFQSLIKFWKFSFQAVLEWSMRNLQGFVLYDKSSLIPALPSTLSPTQSHRSLISAHNQHFTPHCFHDDFSFLSSSTAEIFTKNFQLESHLLCLFSGLAVEERKKLHSLPFK